MTNTGLFLEALLQVIVLAALFVGLVGLLVPVFPGITVMWLATLLYALVEAAAGKMAVIDWVLFALITVLMIIGNIVDNIIIARHMRDRAVPWTSIGFGYALGLIASIFLTPLIGLIASPLGLYMAEYWRLHDARVAFASKKAWMTGWGWSIGARIGIGVVMIVLWMLWAFL